MPPQDVLHSRLARALGSEDLRSIHVDLTRLGEQTKFLGRGGSGDVYLATFVDHSGQAVPVAVKRLRSDPTRDLQTATRLVREIAIWRTLDHPHILPLVGFHLQSPYDDARLVCPYEPHGSVEQYLKEHNVSTSERLQMVSQVLKAVVYLHGLPTPVTHGDIKAANVLVNQNLQLVLCDFGVAKVPFPTGFTSTASGTKGTLHWCSPELLIQGERTPACDIWACGCLVLEIVKGTKPYAGCNLVTFINLIQSQQHPESEDNLRHPTNLWAVLEHCWHFLPEDRINAAQFQTLWNHLILGVVNKFAGDHKCPRTDEHVRERYTEAGLRKRQIDGPVLFYNANDEPPKNKIHGQNAIATLSGFFFFLVLPSQWK